MKFWKNIYFYLGIILIGVSFLPPYERDRLAINFILAVLNFYFAFSEHESK